MLCIAGSSHGPAADVITPSKMNPRTNPNLFTFLKKRNQIPQNMKIPKLIFSSMLSVLLATILLLFF